MANGPILIPTVIDRVGHHVVVNRSVLVHRDPPFGAWGGIMLKVGQVLYDNDQRHRGRKVEVIRVEGAYAVCMCGPRQVRVRLDYIFSDGKPRRSGYSMDAEVGLSSSAGARP